MLNGGNFLFAKEDLNKHNIYANMNDLCKTQQFLLNQVMDYKKGLLEPLESVFLPITQTIKENMTQWQFFKHCHDIVRIRALEDSSRHFCY